MIQDGVFHAATELYGITFAERDDLGAYHPDARVFEVEQRRRLAGRTASCSTCTPATPSAAARG